MQRNQEGLSTRSQKVSAILHQLKRLSGLSMTRLAACLFQLADIPNICSLASLVERVELRRLITLCSRAGVVQQIEVPRIEVHNRHTCYEVQHTTVASRVASRDVELLSVEHGCFEISCMLYFFFPLSPHVTLFQLLDVRLPQDAAPMHAYISFAASRPS